MKKLPTTKSPQNKNTKTDGKIHKNTETQSEKGKGVGHTKKMLGGGRRNNVLKMRSKNFAEKGGGMTFGCLDGGGGGINPKRDGQEEKKSWGRRIKAQ